MFMPKKRILMVEDAAGLTRLLKLNLEETGQYEVLSVKADEDALEAARLFRPDLVLLDVVMSKPVELQELMDQLEIQLETNRE
jgi:DNA-binding response OmpR family regulator